MNRNTAEVLSGLVMFLVVGVLVFAVTTLAFLVPVLILWWAWNAVMPMLFGLPVIGFWHALALSLLLSTVRSVINISTRAK